VGFGFELTEGTIVTPIHSPIFIFKLIFGLEDLWLFVSGSLDYVLDRPKGSLAHLLRPNTIQSLNTTFGNITWDTPFPREGGARSKQDRLKRAPTSLYTFPQ